VIGFVKTSIKSQIANQEAILLQRLNCTQLGASLVDVENAICGRFLSGLDAIWLSYAVLGLAAAISMPALIYATNRLLAASFRVDPEAMIVDRGEKTVGSKSYRKVSSD
jgi:hypothetical protein